MVGAVSGAGLSVTGSLDTSMIERGFNRISQSFEGVKGQAKSFTSDVVRMNIETGKLAKRLVTIGMVGVTAIVGLASKAPAVAGSMAKIGVTTDKLIRTLGTQFAPEFAKVADMYSKFVTFVEAHPDLTKGFVFSATAVAGLVAAGKFVKILGTTVVSASLLKSFGTLGLLIAAAIAAKEAGEWVAEQTYEKAGKKVMEEAFEGDTRTRPMMSHMQKGFPAGVITYAGDLMISYFKGLLQGDKEDNRRDQLLQSDDATWG